MKNKLKIAIIITSVILVLIIFTLTLFLQRGKTPPFEPEQTQRPTLIPISIPPGAPSDLPKQIQADENFSKAESEIYSTFPWYDSFPLSTKDYFVYFDIAERRFIGKIYSTSNNLSPLQVDQIKTSVGNKISSMGIDTNTYKIVWQTGF